MKRNEERKATYEKRKAAPKRSFSSKRRITVRLGADRNGTGRRRKAKR